MERVGVARRLLRPRRPLAARHPAPLAGAADAGRRPAAARAVRSGRRWRRSRRGCAPPGAPRRCRCRRSSRCPRRSAPPGCRSPSPSSASGSSTGSSREARPTTSPWALRAVRAARPAALAAQPGRDRAPPRGPAHDVPRIRRTSRCRWSHPAASAAAGAAAHRPRGAARSRRGRPRRAAWPPPRPAAPFDLARGPLFRVRLLQLGGRRARPARSPSITSSPTAGRWASWRASSRRCTRRSASGAPRRCPSCRSSTRTTPSGSAGGSPARCSTAQLAFWRQRLAGLPPLELPADRPRPPLRSQRGAALSVALPPAAGRGARGPRPAAMARPPS